MVVEDEAEHLSIFSRFLSAPLGNERAAAFSTELLQTAKEEDLASECENEKGIEFFWE